MDSWETAVWLERCIDAIDAMLVSGMQEEEQSELLVASRCLRKVRRIRNVRSYMTEDVPLNVIEAAKSIFNRSEE